MRLEEYRLDPEEALVKIGQSMRREGFSDEEIDQFLDTALSRDYLHLLLVCAEQVEKLKRRDEQNFSLRSERRADARVT